MSCHRNFLLQVLIRFEVVFVSSSFCLFKLNNWKVCIFTDSKAHAQGSGYSNFRTKCFLFLFVFSDDFADFFLLVKFVKKIKLFPCFHRKSFKNIHFHYKVTLRYITNVMENVMLGTICIYYKMRWSKASAKSQFMTSIMYAPPPPRMVIGKNK